MSNRGLKLKSIYRPSSRLEVFYTGGATCIFTKGLLACACNDEVKLVDPVSGSVTSTLAGDTEPVTALAFSPSGNRLYSASRSLQQRCWDVSNDVAVRSWKGHKGPVLALAVDPSGGLLASASADRSCRIWDTDGFYCTHAFHGHRGLVLEVIFHPKEAMIITAGDDAEVRVWDLITKTCVATLKDHFSAVTSLSLTPDGWTLLTAGRDKVAILWDLRSHKKIVTVPVFEAVEGAMVVPGNSALKPMIQGALGKNSKAIVFATGGERGVLKLWRADTGDCIYEQRQGLTANKGQSASAGEDIREIHILPNAEGFMVATGDCRLLFFNPKEEAEKQVLQLGRQLIGNLDEVTDLRLIGPPSAPTQLVLATNSPTIRVFDLATMSCSATLTGHTDTVLVLDALHTKGDKTVLASGAKDNSVRVWDETGACLAVGQGHAGAVSALAFSRRALNFLVSGGADKLLKVWDVSKLLDASTAEAEEGKTPRLRATAAVAAHDKDINALAVSPNDALICTASQDRTAKVWRLPDLVQTLTLKGHRRGVWSVQFSPVDQCVLTGSGDATIRLWALADGSCLRTFEGHGASVLRSAFISAGTQVVSAGADGLVKLWGVRSSECTTTFDEHDGKVWALTVAGEQDAVLATGGADARVNIWRDCTAEDEAAAVATRTQAVVKAQELSNALKDNDYQSAAVMAFQLGHAGQLRSVVEAIRARGQEEAETLLNALVAGFDADQIKQCMEYVREWNTNSRHCHAAQATLQAIFTQHSPEVLLGIPGVASLLDGLSAYTQRHMARIERLRRSVALLDYTLGAMRVVAPQEGAVVPSRDAPVQPQPQPAPQPPAEPAHVPAPAPQPMAADAAADLDPHSSESDLTAATGLERPLGSDEEDIELEEIDIRAIERVSPRTVTDAGSLGHLQDEAESRDGRMHSSAGPSAAPSREEGEQEVGVEEGVQTRRKRRKARQGVGESDGAAADMGGEEQVQEQEVQGHVAGQGRRQPGSTEKNKAKKKQSSGKTSILKRAGTPAVKRKKGSQ